MTASQCIDNKTNRPPILQYFEHLPLGLGFATISMTLWSATEIDYSPIILLTTMMHARQTKPIFLFTAAAFFVAIALWLGGIQTLAISQSDTKAFDLKTVDVKSDPQFANYRKAVTEYGRAKRPGLVNDFCILGYLTGDNLKNAFVIWRQGRQIIVWYGGDEPLADSQRIINLRSDVVPTENDLHGSTYLVTKAWVAEVTKSCSHNGLTIHVPKE